MQKQPEEIIFTRVLSAIFIDPVNIEQINATKIHYVSNVSDGNLLVGMRCGPSSILAVKILRYSFDLDFWMDAKSR